MIRIEFLNSMSQSVGIVVNDGGSIEYSVTPKNILDSLNLVGRDQFASTAVTFKSALGEHVAPYLSFNEVSNALTKGLNQGEFNFEPAQVINRDQAIQRAKKNAL